MRNLPPLPLIDGCLFIDNSGWMEGMSTCYRSLQYKQLNGRVSAGEKPSLNFGSAIHLALEYRYVRYGNRPVDSQYYQDIALMFTDFFALHPPPEDDWRTLNWAMELIKKYNEKYQIEEFSLLKYDKPIACPYCAATATGVERSCNWCLGTGERELMVELPFALPLFEWEGEIGMEMDSTGWRNQKRAKIPVIYTGRIDLPLSLDGHVFITDHKTTGMLGDMFWNQMRMTSQQRGYVWAFEQLAKVPVHGYQINALRTKEPPQYVLAGKPGKTGAKMTPEAWWNESLARERFLMKPRETEDWKSNTIDLVEEFLWHYSRDYMPMKTSWCSSYGKCPYFDVCQMVPEDRGALLHSGQYTDNLWSPLNKTTQPKQ